MCRDLDALRQSIKTYAGQFDARCLLPAQAAQVVRVCAQIEASIASISALAAAGAADGNMWRDEGYRSPADHLAHDTGEPGPLWIESRAVPSSYGKWAAYRNSERGE